MIRGFVLGAIVGGLVVWVWRDSALQYAQAKSFPVRAKVADTLKTLQDKAEGFADTAKENISATLENTRRAILPAEEGTPPLSGVRRVN
jgi:hypothetical protein